MQFSVNSVGGIYELPLPVLCNSRLLPVTCSVFIAQPANLRSATNSVVELTDIESVVSRRENQEADHFDRIELSH